MDPHLEEHTICTFLTTPPPVTILTQTLDTPTARQQATVCTVPSPNHSWQEVNIFNLMRLKYFMKQLKTYQLKKQQFCLDYR